MFTGITTDIGRTVAVGQLDKGRRFTIATALDLADLHIGASIAHAGVCLTVTRIGDGEYDVEAWEEALRLTTLGALRPGDGINLERALRVGDEIGGHFVTGHIDGMGRIAGRVEEGEAVRFVIEAPSDLAPFVAEKGSICLDGNSLTVNNVGDNRFDALIIRHTLDVTTWRERRVGDEVNIEVDRMARHLARLLQYAPAGPR